MAGEPKVMKEWTVGMMRLEVAKTIFIYQMLHVNLTRGSKQGSVMIIDDIGLNGLDHQKGDPAGVRLKACLGD